MLIGPPTSSFGNSKRSDDSVVVSARHSQHQGIKMTHFIERNEHRDFTVRRRSSSETADAAIYLSSSKHAARTIVAVKGDIDESNADDITEFVGGVITTVPAFVLDLSGVKFLAVEGFRALTRIHEDCFRAGVVWILITSKAVDLVLDVVAGKHRLPAMRSLDAALHLLTACARANQATVTPISRTRC
jgi:anti-anti-sigma factor